MMSTSLMKNKKGLVMGVANDRSIAWAIAKSLSNSGAKVALTYQGEALKKRVGPLAKEINSSGLIPNFWIYCGMDFLSMNGVHLLSFLILVYIFHRRLFFCDF